MCFIDVIVCGLDGLLCLLLVLCVGVFNFALFVGLCLFGLVLHVAFTFVWFDLIIVVD